MNKLNKVFSALVFLSVLSAVGLTSNILVQRSLSEQTNVELAQKAIQEVKDSEFLAATREQPQVVLASQNKNKCNIADPESLGDSLSVVNLLYAMGEDYSFENRARLASDYGIENYTGTEVQNIVLVYKLKADSGCFEG